MASIIHQPDCFMCVLCLKDSPRSGASGLTSVGLKPKRKGTLRGEVRTTRRKGVKDGKTGRESERGCDRREKGKKKKRRRRRRGRKLRGGQRTRKEDRKCKGMLASSTITASAWIHSRCSWVIFRCICRTPGTTPLHPQHHHHHHPLLRAPKLCC